MSGSERYAVSMRATEHGNRKYFLGIERKNANAQ